MMTMPARDERGAALVMALVYGFGLLLLALVVSQVVVNSVRPSDDAEKSFQAWTAAEAGIDDLRARIAAAQGAADYTAAFNAAVVASGNPAIAGWVPIPGGNDGDSRFTYIVDSSRASSAGRITVTSTGYSGGQYRTVKAELAKRTTFDYGYASNYETIAPDYPPLLTGSGGSFPLTRAQARTYCGNRYWADSGPSPAYPTGPTPPTINFRNSAACLGSWLTNWSLGEGDKFVGSVHTNDVFTMRTGTNGYSTVKPNTIFTGTVSSSCPDPSAVTYGCTSTHRFLREDQIGTANESGGADFVSTTGTTWTPSFQSKMEIRSEGMTILKQKAQAAGCLFTGPTRIRFYSDGSFSVTSPDSKSANPTTGGINCGGTTLQSTTASPYSGATFQATTGSSGTLSSAFNGVIYVQDVPATGDVNAWPSGAPTCVADKDPATGGNQVFPYFKVPYRPTDGTYPEGEGFASADTAGFPDKGANTSGQVETFSTDLDGGGAYTESCKKGTIYVEGAYNGRFTIVADQDIALTSDLVDSSVLRPTYRQLRTGTVSPNYSPVDGWGRPVAGTSTSVLGVVPRRMLYVYGCDTSRGCNQFDRAKRTTNLVLNFASVVVNGCLTVMDPTLQTQYGRLTVVGSLGQKYRCPISKPSGASGFGFYVEYDSRFAYLEPPPYLAELSQEPWRIQSEQEIHTASVTLPTAAPA